MRSSVFYKGMNVKYLRFNENNGQEHFLIRGLVNFIDDKIVKIEYLPVIGSKRNKKDLKTIPLKNILLVNSERFAIN